MISLSQLIPTNIIADEQYESVFELFMNPTKDVWIYVYNLAETIVVDNGEKIEEIVLLMENTGVKIEDHFQPAIVLVRTSSASRCYTLMPTGAAVFLIAAAKFLLPEFKTLLLYNNHAYAPRQWENLKAYRPSTNIIYNLLRPLIAEECVAVVKSLPSSTERIDVIDLGCAWGQALTTVFSRLNDTRVFGHGIDFLESNIKRAHREQEHNNNIFFHHANYAELPKLFAHYAMEAVTTIPIVISSGGLSHVTLSNPYELIDILLLAYRSRVEALILCSVTHIPITARLAMKVGYSLELKISNSLEYYVLRRMDQSALCDLFCRQALAKNKAKPVEHLNLSFSPNPAAYILNLAEGIKQQVRSVDISYCYFTSSEFAEMQAQLYAELPNLTWVSCLGEVKEVRPFECPGIFWHVGKINRESLLALHLYDDYTQGLNVARLALKVQFPAIRVVLSVAEMEALLAYLHFLIADFPVKTKSDFDLADVNVLDQIKENNILIILLLANICRQGYSVGVEGNAAADVISNNSTGEYMGAPMVCDYKKEGDCYQSLYVGGMLSTTAYKALLASRQGFFMRKMAKIDVEASAHACARYESLKNAEQHYQQLMLK